MSRRHGAALLVVALLTLGCGIQEASADLIRDYDVMTPGNYNGGPSVDADFAIVAFENPGFAGTYTVTAALSSFDPGTFGGFGNFSIHSTLAGALADPGAGDLLSTGSLSFSAGDVFAFGGGEEEIFSATGIFSVPDLSSEASMLYLAVGLPNNDANWAIGSAPDPFGMESYFSIGGSSFALGADLGISGSLINITAVPAPGALVVLIAGGLLGGTRRRR